MGADVDAPDQSACVLRQRQLCRQRQPPRGLRVRYGSSLWLGKRLAATAIALIVAVSFGVLKAAFKVAKWRRALLKAEMAEAEYPGYMLRRQASEDQTGHVILICFANVGSGHKVAAKAVEAAIEARKAANPERYGKVNVVLLDAMDLCHDSREWGLQMPAHRGL